MYLICVNALYKNFSPASSRLHFEVEHKVDICIQTYTDTYVDKYTEMIPTLCWSACNVIYF